MARFSSDYDHVRDVHATPMQVDHAQLTIKRDSLDRIVFTSYATVIAVVDAGVCWLTPRFYSMTTSTKHKPKVRKIARRMGWELCEEAYPNE